MERVLVTGATGYIGGRLIPRLLEEGVAVRAMVRDRLHAEGKPWAEQVELCEADVSQPETLVAALEGVETAYYLIHSMSAAKTEFAERDRAAALAFGEAARAAGVRHIVYLGGLGDPDANLSEHLRSRQETGRALAAAGVPVTEFRAAIIVGSGSISFEMIRYLTERLPVMVTPKWVATRVQPIAIRDVLSYLLRARSSVPEGHRVVEIGGPDVLTYRDLMLQYAEARGLRRVMLPVPVLTPHLSSYWVHLITPIPASVAQPLVRGLSSEVVVKHPEAAAEYGVSPIPYREAVRLALDRAAQGRVETLWSTALYEPQPGPDAPPVLEDEQGLLFDRRVRRVAASPERAFAAILKLGGEEGWYAFNWLWQLRGRLDRLAGGVGLRRGRRDPEALVPGDVLDFWRVELVEPPSHLQLRAEMKLPGRAWLRFDVTPDGGGAEIRQTAYYEPKGLFGYLYWWSVYPLHALLFPAMLRAIAARAER